jgi:beta-phosphoglucomutase family hydrolase
LFDLDGVLTRTASIHAAAWKQMFDEYLTQRARETDQAFVPFDLQSDYELYVDGLTRADGARAFLEARGIKLPDGSEDDSPGVPTVHGLANRKNVLVNELLSHGVEVFDGSIRYVEAVRDAGLPSAVVSSSANTAKILEVAGIAGLFEARIDGVVAAQRHIPGKPAPDMFLAGAAALGLEPEQAAVFEDALAGVEAGRRGGFAFVVGVDRVGQADELRAHGADVVVDDLADLLERS